MKRDKPLVILHGWSDNARSFQTLVKTLQEKGHWNPKLINLADYVSMDDEIQFIDLAYALEKAWQKENLPRAKGSVDLIAHSTGALVTRLWLQTFYAPDTAPIKHFLMLAPANFGSHLAHKGRAFYGRVIKGFSSRKMFEVGEKLLHGLELASPFTWELGEQDQFAKNNFYQPGRVLSTVLVGNKGYSGISAAANESGSDGTVRLSTANLNCARLKADFSRNPLQPEFHLEASSSQTAFGVLEGENHSTIVAKDRGFKNYATLNYIIRALTVSDDGFSDWCDELEKHTTQTMQLAEKDTDRQGYQNTVCRVRDQFGNSVNDYFLEYFGAGRAESTVADLFHNQLLKTVHAYSGNKSYRSLYFNCTKLHQHCKQKSFDLSISLTAMPVISQHGLVGYRTLSDDDIGAIKIPCRELKNYFISNRSFFVDITLRREQGDKLFIFT